MTVNTYRLENPDCYYCIHSLPLFNYCKAINKKKSKRMARKCPCYVPRKWETKEKGGVE